MSKILELREKRAKAWDAAKAFLDSKRGADGLLSAEDATMKRWKLTLKLARNRAAERRKHGRAQRVVAPVP